MIDKQMISLCRNLLQEYGPVLERVREEIERQENAATLAKGDAFDLARQAIRREAVKEGIGEFIGRIKHYGSQRPE